MHGIQHWAQLAGLFLISGIWQGFVLAATLWLCLRLVPRATAALRFALWTVVLLVIALLPILEGVQESLPHTHAVTSAGHPLLHLDPRWSLALAIVWAALSLYRAGALALHALHLWSLRRRTVPVTPDAACAAILAGTTRTITLCTSTEVERPSVIGFLAPRILIPTWLFREYEMGQLTPSELHQIVLHEMEHLRRGDDWLNLIQKLALVLFPLNPILLWVERRLCFERELACDDGVLRRTHAPRAYATCLATLAERGLDRIDRLDRRALSLALGALGAFTAAARQSELARRVHRILRHESTLTRPQSRALTAAVGLTLIAGAAGLAHCPQLVSFTPTASPTVAQTITPADLRQLSNPRLPDAHIEQAAFHAGQPAHMTLLKASASLPGTTKVSIKAAKRTAVHPSRPSDTLSLERVASRPRTRSTSDSNFDAQQLLRLTSWSEVHHQMALPIVDTTVEGHPVLLPYAAVPTAGGWLIVQL